MSFSQHLVLWLHVAFVIFTIGPVTLAIMSTPRYIRKRDIRILRYLTRMTLIFVIASLGVLVSGVVLSSMIGKAAKPWIIISETLFVVSVLLLGLIQRDQRRALKALEKVQASAASVSAAAGPAAELAGSGAARQLASTPAAQAQPAQGQAAQAKQAQAPAGQSQPGQAEHSQGTGAGPAPGAASAAGPAGGDQPSGHTPVGQAPSGQPGGQAASGQAPSGQPAAQGQAADAAASAHLATVERGRIAMIGGVVTVIWLAVLVLMVWNG
jgi:hypothetical protein